MDREKAFARLGAAAELIPDFNTLTATGGRLVGTGSEALARDWLQQRLQKIPEVRLGAHSFNYSGWASTYSSFELVTVISSACAGCSPPDGSHRSASST